MLSDDLKEETLPLHQQTEKQLIARIKSISNIADYVALLQLFYSYFGGLEELINQYVTTAQLPDHEQRRKTEALVNDIKTFEAQPAEKAGLTDLPQINNIAKALGALYVIEGSTLGGGIISKMISGRTGIDQGLTFFNGYCDASMEMWGVFKNMLNNRPHSEHADIIKGANDTFLYFSKWIEKVAATA